MSKMNGTGHLSSDERAASRLRRAENRLAGARKRREGASAGEVAAQVASIDAIEDALPEEE